MACVDDDPLLNHYLYITRQNFKNPIVFQVTFRLVVNWGGNMISLCSLFFGIFSNEKCLRAEVSCLFIILPLTFFAETSNIPK